MAQIVWLFILAITLHNLEEAIWLPQWSRTGGKWHPRVGDFEFRVAVVILTVTAIVFAVASTVGGKESWGTYAVTGYAFAMLLNVFSPHVLVTVVTPRYMPGLATAVLAVLPTTGYLVSIALAQDYVRTPQFFGWAALMTVGLLASIRPLFALGRRLGAGSKRSYASAARATQSKALADPEAAIAEIGSLVKAGNAAKGGV